MTRSGHPTIVVGVDGSPSSREALRWAVQQAGYTGAHLHAMTVWSMPTTYGWVPPVADFDWKGTAAATLETVLAENAGDLPAERLRREVVEGHAARRLLDAAEGAELLVVGSDGHGRFAEMLLGSVALHVVTHARCPVAVIPVAPSEH